MKKCITAFAILAIVVFAGFAHATPKFVNAIPTATVDGNVTIPALPTGAELINVEIYNDNEGSPPRHLGPAHSFKLKSGEGFNFIWRDKEGTWYQLITDRDKNPTGLVIDCTWLDPQGRPACKYLFIK